jgi:hypothetical protein
VTSRVTNRVKHATIVGACFPRQSSNRSAPYNSRQRWPGQRIEEAGDRSFGKADEGTNHNYIAHGLSTIRDSDKLREQSLALPRVRAERQILRRSGIGLFKLS